MTARIIQTKEPLSTDEFVPRELLHRKSQLEAVREELRPVIEDDSEHSLILHGPIGTGKTTLIKFLIDRMEDHVPPFAYAYVNCWEKYTKFNVLHAVVKQAGNFRITDKDLVDTSDLVSKIDKIKESRPLVVVIDEADLLDDLKLLYNLTGGNVGIIRITNDLEKLYKVDARTWSRLSGSATIEFPRYKHSEMLDILDRRQNVALRQDALSEDQLDYIADEAAGDARKGIRLLRFAAECAEKQGHDTITDEDIETVKEKAKKNYREKNISRLNRHQRAMYDIIEEDGPLSPGQIYQKYMDRMEDPVSKRTMQRYLPKMERYNIIRSTGNTNARTIAIAE